MIKINHTRIARKRADRLPPVTREMVEQVRARLIASLGDLPDAAALALAGTVIAHWDALLADPSFV